MGSIGAPELIVMGLIGLLVIGVPVIVILVVLRLVRSGGGAGLVPCPGCGSRVSPRATSCPKCGEPIAPAG